MDDGAVMLQKSEIMVTNKWTVKEIYFSKNKETRRIVWLHYSGWEPDQAPSDIETILEIHSTMRRLRRPHVFMSLAGAGRAGAYAAFEVSSTSR